MQVNDRSFAATRCFRNASHTVNELVRSEIQKAIGHLRPRRILLKPNWVLHETDPAFPIRALVTDARLIEATAEACFHIFPDAQSIIVGDCPLQSADWTLLCQQSGLQPVIDRLEKLSNGKIEFRDLRKYVFKPDQGNFLVSSDVEHGDPRGYREVELGERSHLEAISSQTAKFAVNDYSSSVTSSNHQQGSHRYLVCQSVLDADLVINLPKWKTHQKSGITCALKNLVGINGDKAYLPHFRRGAPKWGGDEYRDENRWLYWMQTRLREAVQKRSRFAYKVLKPGWELIKKLRGIETRMADLGATPKNFYIAGGAWHGNDTIWRMIYDLNLIIQCVDASGKLHSTAQRNYFCIVDGLVSGEGNGPLQPLPRETDWLVFGTDPFAIDVTLAWCMGFSPAKIPVLCRRSEYIGPDWGNFDIEKLVADFDEKLGKVIDQPINFKFVPPPGWRNEVER